MQNLLPYRGEAYFYPDFFTREESDRLYQHLLSQVSWKQMPIKIFGREIMQPRLTAWFADKDVKYTYSGLTLTAFEWTDTLLEIKQHVEKVSGAMFNSALLNLYRDGKDSMGWHRDNEKELGRNPVVASVSFGATRQFKLRDYGTKNNVVSLDLKHGSFLWMQGETQHYWEHSVPKTNREIGERINVTFRLVK